MWSPLLCICICRLALPIRLVLASFTRLLQQNKENDFVNSMLMGQNTPEMWDKRGVLNMSRPVRCALLETVDMQWDAEADRRDRCRSRLWEIFR
jgi:hypothetical protein